MSYVNTVHSCPAFVASIPLIKASVTTPICTTFQRRAFTVASIAVPSSRGVENSFSRRSFVALIAAAPLVSFLPSAANADAISSQLTPYRDLPKGFTILRPNGWNEFEALQDNYDIKWQDVIQPLEFITVLTNPVDKDKHLEDLGTAQEVGSRLASSRSGELVSVQEKNIDGIPAYLFEIKRDKSRQLTLLCINKMKLYSVNASSSERRWSKREKLLRATVNSFKPKL